MLRLLSSIDERLRGMSAPVSVLPSINNAEGLARRLEAVEVQLNQVVSVVELRLDKVSESIIGHHTKEELAADRLSRKLDVAVERLNHRLGYLEARLDAAISKFAARFEALPHEIQGIVVASEVRLSEQMSRLLQYTTVQEGGSDDVGESVSHVLKNVFRMARDKQLHGQDIQSKGRDPTDCQELWQCSTHKEDLVKQAGATTNATQHKIQELIDTMRRFEDVATVSELEDMETRTEMKFIELSTRLNSKFHEMLMAQEAFSDDCHRIQLGQPQLEMHLALMLERILDAISNRTSGVSNRLLEMQNTAQLQNMQIHQSLEEVNDLLRRAMKRHNLDSKDLATAIELLGGLMEDEFRKLMATIMPLDQSVADLVVQDLKPLLLDDARPHRKTHDVEFGVRILTPLPDVYSSENNSTTVGERQTVVGPTSTEDEYQTLRVEVYNTTLHTKPQEPDSSLNVSETHPTVHRIGNHADAYVETISEHSDADDIGVTPTVTTANDLRPEKNAIVLLQTPAIPPDEETRDPTTPTFWDTSHAPNNTTAAILTELTEEESVYKNASTTPTRFDKNDDSASNLPWATGDGHASSQGAISTSEPDSEEPDQEESLTDPGSYNTTDQDVYLIGKVPMLLLTDSDEIFDDDQEDIATTDHVVQHSSSTDNANLLQGLEMTDKEADLSGDYDFDTGAETEVEEDDLIGEEML